MNELKSFLEEAKSYPFKTVCVPPCYVKDAVAALKGTETGVSTVSAFPLGYQTIVSKIVEVKDAQNNGASEVDVVANISLIKSNNFTGVATEVMAITASVPDMIVKVIIECAYLTKEEKELAAKAVLRGKAHYIKTSTGFGPGGATLEDVQLLKNATEGSLLIKAAGGIKTLDEALEFLNAGAERIGTSRGIEILSSLQ